MLIDRIVLAWLEGFSKVSCIGQARVKKVHQREVRCQVAKNLGESRKLKSLSDLKNEV